MIETSALPPKCKCCSSSTSLFSVYDFNRSCLSNDVPSLGAASRPVSYYQCRNCGFIFTPYFDDYTSAQWKEEIYNDQYILVDPEFETVRPVSCYEDLASDLGEVEKTLDALDYGGGGGTLAKLMRAAGYQNYVSFDPYFDTASRPQRQFDLVTSFEVMEHSSDPFGTFQDALSFVAPQGAFLFSTALQPLKTDKNWWYIAPRNGHISIYSDKSVQVLAERNGCQILSLDHSRHIIYRDPHSSLVRRIVKQHGPLGSLYSASLRSGVGLLNTSLRCMELGFVREALNPKHAIRFFVAKMSAGRH